MQGEELGRSKEEREKANKQVLQHLHQQGGQKASTSYLLTKKKNDKVVAIKVNKQANNGVKRFLGAKGNYFQHEEHQEGLDPEREVRSQMDFEEFGDLAKYGCILWGASLWTR